MITDVFLNNSNNLRSLGRWASSMETAFTEDSSMAAASSKYANNQFMFHDSLIETDTFCFFNQE